MKTLSAMLTVLLVTGATVITFSQNKTLGVGTASPNPNAALHVESPTNNQGVIIPRLTTAQRTSFTGALTAVDVGLIVFDTDLRALTIWNGTAWDIGLKAGEPITATSNSATGNAGTFTVSNAANGDVAINATTTGTGHAAYVEVDNPANANAALYVGTNGTGNAITASGTVQATSFIGDGSALSNLPTFDFPYSNTVNSGSTLFGAANVGTGGGADFRIINGTNPNNALYAETSGTGRAADIRIINPASSAEALAAITSGVGNAFTAIHQGTIGSAAQLTVLDVTNTSPALQITHGGTGHAITANAPIAATQFIGDGSALTNVISDSARVNTVTGNAIVDFTIENKDISTTTSILGTKILPDFGVQNVSTTGTITATSFIGDGSALTGISGFNLPYSNSVATAGSAFNVANTGSGFAGLFQINSASNALAAISGETNAQGPAAEFVINNPTNTSPVLNLSTNGTGYAISATAPIQATQFIGDGSALSGIDEFTVPYSLTLDVTGNLLSLTNSNTSFGTAQFISSGTGAYTLETFSTGLGAFSAQNTGTGSAGVFSSTSSATTLQATNSGGMAFSATNAGTVGSAATIGIGNAGNSNAALQINHAGSGNAITANAPIQATAFVGDGSALTGIPGFTLPYAQAPGNASTLFDITNTGAGGTAAFNSSGGGTPLTIDQSSTGTANGLVVNQNATAGFAIEVNSNGTGAGNGIDLQYFGSGHGIHSQVYSDNGIAGRFFNSSATNVSPAIEARTLGQASVATFTTANAGSGAPTIYATTNGTSNAAQFDITEASNTAPVLSINHGGVGNAITANAPVSAVASRPGLMMDVQNNGNGGAAEFRLNGTGSSNTALSAYNEGLGYAGYFRNGNASSTGNAILAENYGTGPTLRSYAFGTGDAGQFSVLGTTNPADALVLDTQGTGSLLVGNATSLNTSQAVVVNDAGSGSATLRVDKTGTGASGWFSITNASNNSNTIFASTDGIGATIYSQNTGGSQGAGQFVVSNGGNTAAALSATTNGTGPALRLTQSNGLAIDILGGGLRYSVQTVSSLPATVDSKVGIYNVTVSAGTLTLGTTGRVNGETVIVTMEVAGSVTISGLGNGGIGNVLIGQNDTRIFIYINGTWRSISTIGY